MTRDWAKKVLIVAPHADDETLGCGGLIMHALNFCSGKVRVLIAALGHEASTTTEQTQGELDAAMKVLGVEDYRVLWPGYQGRLNEVRTSALITSLDKELSDFRPTAVFAPYASHHQDHRTLYEAVVASMRPRSVTLPIELFALFEYPYAAAWPAPDLPGGKFYLTISEGYLARKLAALAEYKTQFARDTWCSLEHVESWARQRGHEVGRTAAEAFWVVRGLLA